MKNQYATAGVRTLNLTIGITTAIMELMANVNKDQELLLPHIIVPYDYSLFELTTYFSVLQLYVMYHANDSL